MIAIRQIGPVLLLALVGIPLFGQTRISANYSITTEVTDEGGGIAGSGAYNVNSSLGTIDNTPAVISPAEIAKSGFIGQLYNLAGLEITAPSSSVNEGQTLQLSAVGSLDDGTVVVLNPTLVTWTIISGPLATISGSGIATGAFVYDHTAAQISGAVDAFAGTLSLTVINTSYDSWESQYFGTNNSSGASIVDADGTGQTNAFKYIADLNPTDPSSRFVVTEGSADVLAGQMAITFAPIFAGRTYTVQYCSNLISPNWRTLSGASETTSGSLMTIVDTDANGPSRFYRVLISN